MNCLVIKNVEVESIVTYINWRVIPKSPYSGKLMQIDDNTYMYGVVATECPLRLVTLCVSKLQASGQVVVKVIGDGVYAIPEISNLTKAEIRSAIKVHNHRYDTVMRYFTDEVMPAIYKKFGGMEFDITKF